MRYEILCRSLLFSAAMDFGEVNSSLREIVPLESPDSHNDIGRMSNRAILPVPVWWSSSSLAGTADPVRMNCPIPWRWSTSKRTISHNLGVCCHSSINRGVFPSNITFGVLSTKIRYWSLRAESDI